MFYDSKLKEDRILEFKDISVLSRSLNDTKIERLIEILRQKNIPVNITNKQSLNEIESVMIILHILKLITNSGDDVSLVSFLTSALVGLTFDDLMTINQLNNKGLINKLIFYTENFEDELAKKITNAFNLLEEIKLNTTCKNCIEIIDMILYKYHLKYYILNSVNGVNEFNALSNLIMFFSATAEKSIIALLISSFALSASCRYWFNVTVISDMACVLYFKISPT